MPKTNSRTPKKARWEQDKLERSQPLLAKNQKQRDYIEAICTSPTTISMGSAGTGKTFIAASLAAENFLRKDIRKIILTRPLVSVGKTAGLLPGTLDEKLEPWFKPITEVLEMKLGKAVYEIGRKSGAIEFAPFEQMQGRSFRDAFIILDEAQNCSLFELRMFLTRLGENVTAIVDGDVRQCSLKEDSGLKQLIKIIEDCGLPVPVIEFTPDEVVRSGQCRMWIKAFDESGF